ncbi:MAG TPA: family 43 glycosylhydrolase [Segetibacter sp.]
MKKVIIAVACLLTRLFCTGQDTQMSTYCNPINIDYTYSIYNAGNGISYRSGADPAVVRFRGEYYMFVTRSMGYWHSTDLTKWDFITPQRWYFMGENAPAAHNYKDSVLYVAGDPSGTMSILHTDDPKKGDWKASPVILYDLQDPDLFIDDDGQAYMFWGSSNVYPLRGKKLDKSRNFLPSEQTVELFKLDGKQHGWERFGENHSDTVLAGYMEGAWLTKHNNKYYMQYAAPGTEFNVYGDGVYMSDSALGPYKYAPNNPVYYKPGGFMNGAGHGSTVLGPDEKYWHFGSMALSVNVNWERRICLFPTYFDKEGLMYSNTSFGDYPHFAPAVPGKMGGFAGWMLLSYKKPVKASSVQGQFSANNLVDENVKTFWVADKNDDQQWLQIDLLKASAIHAIQVNYHDYKSNIFGRMEGMHHRYVIEGSTDGTNWSTLVNRRNSFKDAPNDYVELSTPATARYIRYKNIQVPSTHLAISDIRVFGVGSGKVPTTVKNFSVKRQADRRDAIINWNKQANCQGYNIYWGVAPDKLYNSWMVYDNDSLLLKSLGVDQAYYFAIEAFNENGVSARTKVVAQP